MNKLYSSDNIQSKLFDYAINGYLTELKRELCNIYNARDKYNNTLLHVAVDARQYSVVEYLLSLCGDNNNRVITLRSFLKNGRPSLYIDMTEIKNNFNNTPFDIAIKNHDQRSIKLFTDHNANKKIEIFANDKNLLQKDLNIANNTIVENTFQITSLRNENTTLKNDKKRLREENDVLVHTNKRLKVDITKYQDMLKNKK